MTFSKKFSFNTSFDQVENLAPGETVYTKAAQEKGYAQGYAQGHQEGLKKGRGEVLKALETLTHKTQRLCETYDDMKQMLHEDIAQTAYAMMKALFPKYAHTHGKQEILEILEDALQERPQEKLLKVVVAPSLLKDLEQAIEDFAPKGFSPDHIQVLSDETLGPLDGRVMWAHGGCERLMSRIWESIEHATQRLVPEEALAHCTQKVETMQKQADPEHKQ